MRGPVNYNSGKELEALLAQYGLGMRKKFGQNFLINGGIREKLLDALEAGTGDDVWEIGPGLGAMTRGLLDRGARVTAFEIDPGFSRLLREIFREDKAFTLVEGDVLKTWEGHAAAPYVLGNLPYNIGAALLAGFIEKGRLFTRIVVTVQREVARRMAAKPGSADYSSFSVLCQSVYDVTPLMVIKGPCFYPVPRVDSQGVRLDLRKDTGTGKTIPPPFYPLVRNLFSSRRKTLKNNLQKFLSSYIIKENAAGAAEAVLKDCGIRGNERAENLTIAGFAALAAAVEKTAGYGENGEHSR
jgi:16S rRNA (adenine1518-N6/adenine1519-N6)-dimethyltransferase